MQPERAGVFGPSYHCSRSFNINCLLPFVLKSSILPTRLKHPGRLTLAFTLALTSAREELELESGLELALELRTTGAGSGKGTGKSQGQVKGL